MHVDVNKNRFERKTHHAILLATSLIEIIESKFCKKY